MALDTIFLIGVLTLLSVNLGSDFLLIVAQFSFQSINEAAFDAVIGNLYNRILTSLSAVFFLALVCAIILNCLPDNSRTEPYLLRIGLGTLIAYGVIFSFNLLLVSHNFSFLEQLTSATHAFFLQSKAAFLLWLRLPVILVCYWSFLHYALNPRV